MKKLKKQNKNAVYQTKSFIILAVLRRSV